MALTCIAVEDEPMALKKLEGFIRRTPFLDLQATFTSSLEALNYLLHHSPNLVFLDIQMDKLNGIQLLESLPSPPMVIITTAFHEYALKGYELEVVDYLLKPYSFERFLQSANKAQVQHNKSVERTSVNHQAEIIFVRTAHQIERVFLDKILYVEGMRDYLGIITPEKRIMCLQNFSKLMEVLPADDFIRVHKSFVVALNKIEQISNHRIQMGDKLIPVSETYQKTFYSALEKYRRVL